MQEHAIRTRDLSLWYGDFQALFDVDLDIIEDEIERVPPTIASGSNVEIEPARPLDEARSEDLEIGRVDDYDELTEAEVPLDDGTETDAGALFEDRAVDLTSDELES